MINEGNLLQKKDDLFIMIPQSGLISKQPFFDGKSLECSSLEVENNRVNDCVHSFFLTHIMPYIKTADNLYSDEHKEFHVPLVFQGNQFFMNGYGEMAKTLIWIKKMSELISELNMEVGDIKIQIKLSTFSEYAEKAR